MCSRLCADVARRLAFNRYGRLPAAVSTSSTTGATSIGNGAVDGNSSSADTFAAVIIEFMCNRINGWHARARVRVHWRRIVIAAAFIGVK